MPRVNLPRLPLPFPFVPGRHLYSNRRRACCRQPPPPLPCSPPCSTSPAPARHGAPGRRGSARSASSSSPTATSSARCRSAAPPSRSRRPSHRRSSTPTPSASSAALPWSRRPRPPLPGATASPPPPPPPPTAPPPMAAASGASAGRPRSRNGSSPARRTGCLEERDDATHAVCLARCLFCWRRFRACTVSERGQKCFCPPLLSVSVFGVSPTSMQCSYDRRGNSVPTILLTMQRKLYSLGGLQAEGIFRINADNSQELYVRDQLNRGVVPDGVDLHCLAGLIKAWFRELPSGVLDSLTPEQVMHCNTEEECGHLASTLPPVEAALLEWAINLMADVVENESYNKMNARNIAMVFAPNMTKMADPLTALIHAVQVMNFLKTLILKTVNEREEAATVARAFPSNSGSPSDKDEPQTIEHLDMPSICSSQRNVDSPIIDGAKLDQFLFRVEEALHHEMQGSTGGAKNHGSSRGKEKSNGETSPLDTDLSSQNEFSNNSEEGLFDRFKFRKGVGRLCRHPVFQFSRSMKKADEAEQTCV